MGHGESAKVLQSQKELRINAGQAFHSHCSSPYAWRRACRAIGAPPVFTFDAGTGRGSDSTFSLLETSSRGSTPRVSRSANRWVKMAYSTSTHSKNVSSFFAVIENRPE